MSEIWNSVIAECKSLGGTYPVWTRCHSCTRLFEIDIDVALVSDFAYTVPEGERVTCPHCDKEHGAGFEMVME